MGTFALRVSDASKPYGRVGHERTIFRAINLNVASGEIVALLGPSGCGKSTLLRAIAALEPLTTGRIAIPLDGGPAPKVGLVFQDPLLLPWLTVADNIGLGLRYRANREASADESLAQLLHTFGLAPLAGAYPEELSGGQAQRVSLARTVVTRPTILLLDEPFSALDPRARAALQEWLLDIVRRRGLTVLLVTHDVDEALALGDRVALMSRDPGTIVQTWSFDRDSDDRVGLRRVSASRQRAKAEILDRYQTDIPLAS